MLFFSAVAPIFVRLRPARCAGKNYFLQVMPERSKQDITALAQGEVLRRLAFYNWNALCSKSLSYWEKSSVGLRGKSWKERNSEPFPWAYGERDRRGSQLGLLEISANSRNRNISSNFDELNEDNTGGNFRLQKNVEMWKISKIKLSIFWKQYFFINIYIRYIKCTVTL